jgi:hypothetical protein
MTLVFEGVEWGRQVVSLKEEKMEEKREGCCRQRERGRGLEIFKKKCNKTSVLYPLPLTITPLNFLMCFKHTQVHLNAL